MEIYSVSCKKNITNKNSSARRTKQSRLMLFGCPTANFGILSRGQPHSPDVNHCILHIQPEGHREPRSEVGSLSPAEPLVGFELVTFQF